MSYAPYGFFDPPLVQRSTSFAAEICPRTLTAEHIMSGMRPMPSMMASPAIGNDSCQVQIRSGIALFYQPNDFDVGLLQTITGKLEYADV